MDEQKLKKLQGWVEEARRMVFFGGAGVSTESGIPDFRGEDGLYRQRYAYPPETIISHSFYVHHPEIFFDFYRNRMLYPNAKPNIVHRKLAQWEKEGKLLAVVTQNIDGLHQMAGSQNVYELHGSVHRNTCQKCGARYTMEELLTLGDVPKCPKCGGRGKPAVVLYEEGSCSSIKQKRRGTISPTLRCTRSWARFSRGFKKIFLHMKFFPSCTRLINREAGRAFAFPEKEEQA